MPLENGINMKNLKIKINMICVYDIYLFDQVSNIQEIALINAIILHVILIKIVSLHVM